MKKKFIHFFTLSFLLLLFGIKGNAQVDNITQITTHTNLQDAISAASTGDLLKLTQNLYIGTSTIAVNKQLTIDGNGNTISTSGGNALFSFSTAGSILQNVNITKTDKTNQGIIYVGGNNITLDAVHIKGEYVLGDSEVSRGMVVASGNNGLNVKNSSFENLRQPAYINGGITNASIENNYVAHTRGWVVVADAQVVFNGNTWGSGIDSNATDIAIIDNNPSISQANIYFQCPVMVLLIANNNSPKVDNQVLVGGCNVHNVTKDKWFSTIQTAISNAATVTGDEIKVYPGVYNEEVTINKSITLIGDGPSNTLIKAATVCTGTSTNNGIKITAANVTIKDIAITDFGFGIRVEASASGLTLENISSSENCNSGLDFRSTGGGIIGNIEILNSKFNDNGKLGIRKGTDVREINGFTMIDCEVKGNEQGFFIAAKANDINKFDNVLIKNSDLSNNTRKGAYFEVLSNAVFDGITMDNCGTDIAYNNNVGLDLNLKYGVYENIELKNSSITNCGVYGTATYAEAPTAVSIFARNDGGYSTNPATITGLSIHNNIISGPENGLKIGELNQVAGGAAKATITNNDLGSSFNNQALLYGGSVGFIDAIANWHGSNDYSSIIGTMVGNINLASYLETGANANIGIPGFTPTGNLTSPAVFNVTQNSYYYSIKDAVDAANANDVIEILDDLAETAVSTVNKKLTIKGNNHIVSITSTMGGTFPPNGLFVITAAGTTIQDLGILKTDNANQNLIYIDANNVTIDNVKFEGQWTSGNTLVAGIFVNYYKEGLNIKNSEFRKLRQAIKLADGVKGNVINNASDQVYQVAANTEIVFSGNTGIPNTNGANIEIITGIFSNDNYYTCPLMDDIKINNANVSLSNTLLNPSSCNRVYNLTQSTWTYGIQAAVDLANNSDVLEVMVAGNYAETINVNKDLTINGPNAGIDPNTGTRVPEAVIQDGKLKILGNNTVVFDGFKFAHVSNSTPIALGGGTVATIQNNIIERNATVAVSGGPASARGIEISNGPGAKNIKNNLFTGDGSGNNYSNTLSWNSGMFINGPTTVINVENNVFEKCRTALNLDDMGAGINISGNTFENNGTYMAFGGTTPSNGSFTLGANEYKAPYDAMMNLSNVASTFRLDISAGSVNGIPFANMTNDELFNVELGMYHRGRSGRNGLVTYKTNNQYVASINPSIQAAINYAPVGGIINLNKLTYTENVNVNKAVDIRGYQYGNAVSGRTFADANESVVQAVSGTTFNLGVGANGGSINGVSVGGSGNGIYMNTTLNDFTIKDNLLSGNNLAVSLAAGSNNINVSNNDITNAYAGIYLSSSAHGNTITKNNIHGLTLGANDMGSAIVLEGNNYNNDISENMLTGNGNGVYVWATFGSNFAGTAISNNMFSSNGKAINNTNTSEINAECNWYGSIVSNDIASMIIGFVDYAPYLVPDVAGNSYFWSAGTNYNCSGTPVEIATVLTDGINCSQGSIEVSFTGGTAPYDLTWNGGSVSNVTSPYTIANLATGTYNITITDAVNSTDNTSVLLTNYPVTNTNNNTYHTTITAAITNATDGDVLEVCAGTYTETINVNKSITLNGPNAGIDPNTGVRVGEAILSNAQFKAFGTKTVVIDGFTIDRTGTNINHGIDLTAGATTVTVQNNIFNRDVTVTGSFALGVYLSNSSAQKIIRNNFFTGRATYSSTGSHRTWRSGIWYNGGNVTIQDNVMKNCNTHINIEQTPANLVIDGNTFSNSSTSFSIGSISAVQAAYFTFGANDFASTISTIINVTSTVDDACRFDISAGSYGGTPFADLTLAQKFTVDGKIYHRTRTKGLVYFVSKNIFNNTINSSQIQTAINYAAAGDTITIANKLFNGTYTEALVIDKPLTLQGQSKANVKINGTAGVNSGIKINSGVEDVTIRDLTIQNVKGTNGNTHAGIYAVGNNNNLSVDNVLVTKGTSGSNASGFYANGPIDSLTINGSEFNDHGTGARGIVVWNGLKTNIAITNNTLANNNCCGIELSDGDASAVTVTGNTISIGDGDNAIGLIGLNGSVGPNLISNNTITGGGRFGIEIKNPNGGVTVSNNNVTLSSQNSDVRDRAGIAVYRRGVLNNNVDVPNGVTITGNIVTGYQQVSNSEGFGIVIEGSNHIVSGNTLNNNDIGILQQQNPSNYPGDADQSNLADNFFGRGNAPTTCANTIGTNTFSSNGEDYRLAGAVSGDIVNARTGNKYCSIQDAIDDGATINGDEINVGPGTYAENVVVNKSVSILGPNATIDGCSVSRVGEAIIFPAISDIDDAINGTIIKVEASDVVISGLTIDGDNPDITTGKSSTNGADIDAAEGITRYGTGNNLVITNNIIKNLSYTGIVMYDYPAGVASSGNVISGNMIQDLGSYDPTIALNNWGIGVMLYNNQYASVTNNCITNVRLGVQTGNFYKANPGSATYQTISNNTISSRRRGVFHNLQYSNASAITIENNNITALVNTNESLWDGILLSSLSVPSITSNNTIDGNNISNTSYGIDVWNVKNTSPALITGGVISNVKTGILVDNFVGYNSNGGDGANATITDVNVNASVTGVSISDNASSTTHGAVSAIVTGSSITAPMAVNISESVTGIVSATFTGNSINSGATLFNSNASNTIDAECNWWGTTTANDISTNVSGAVDFLPYLIPSVSGVTYPWSASTTYSCDGTLIIISSANVTNHASCENGEGSIDLTWSGGTSSYSVSIDGGTASTATSPYTISNLNAGNRTVKVEDANGTFVEQVVTINTYPVKNSTTGLTYATIQDAVDAVGTTNGNELVLCDGPFDEQVIVNKSLSIIPATVSGSPTTPVVNFTGTSTGKPTLFDVSANNVSIEGVQFNVDMSKLKSAIIVSGSGIDKVTIKDNEITPFGIASSGTYSDRNAVSINFAGNTNYRTSTGVNNITFEGNTVNANASDGSNSFRAGISADAAGGTFIGNTITSINQDVQVRFATAPVTMTGNNFNGGGAEYTSPNSGAGSATISNNSFNGNWWIGLNPTNPVANPMLRLKNNSSGANTIVNGNTFTDIRWGISLENYNNNVISNNTFTPLATASDFRHITVNTKGIFGGNITALQRVAISSTITDNTFNGIIGTNTGKGLAFYNHWNDGAGAQYGAFTVSGNTFNKGMQNYIYIDESNGISTSDPTVANNYPEYADNGAAPSTTGYWTKDIVDGDNLYAVGGAGTPKLYNNMSLLEIYGDLYAHIYDQVDNSNIGLVIFGKKPDLELSTRINNLNFIAANNTISNFIVDVFELNGTDLQNTPATPVNIIVFKSNSVFDYTFDPNQTSMNMPMATNINNTNWELVTNNASLMVFKLKDGVPFNGYGFSSIGINIQVKSSASFSNLSINTIIPSNSGGETNDDNNSDVKLVNIQ